MNLNEIKELNKYKNIPNPYEMGLGKLADPRTVFKRQFRWTVEVPNATDIHFWFHKIKADLKNKTLYVEAYDDCKSQVWYWLEDFERDVSSRIITIKDLDGCGNTISETIYSGLEIIKNELNYDYDQNNLQVFNLEIKFKNCIRKK